MVADKSALSTNLAGSLRRSSAGLARDAVNCFTEPGGASRAIQFAGLAVEHLAKAYLATIDPVLLVEERAADLDTLLHLSGNGGLSDQPFDRVRTVGAAVACERVKALSAKKPNLRFVFGERERALFRARNGAVHLAAGSPDGAQIAVQTMVSMVMQLLELLDVKQVEYWATSTDAARMLLDESIEAVRVTVNGKIHAARQRFNRHLSQLSADVRPLVMQAMVGDFPPWTADHESPEKCPACGLQGWVLSQVEDTPGAAPVIDRSYYDDGDYDESGYVDQTAYPIEFVCGACGLNLEGPEEMEAAQIESDGFEHGTRELDPHGADEYYFH